MLCNKRCQDQSITPICKPRDKHDFYGKRYGKVHGQAHMQQTEDEHCRMDTSNNVVGGDYGEAVPLRQPLQSPAQANHEGVAILGAPWPHDRGHQG